MVNRSLTKVQESAIRKIDNMIRKHLKPQDYTNALKDMTGSHVPTPMGGYREHAEEMTNYYRCLRNAVNRLNGATDPASQARCRRALKAIKKIEGLVKGAGV